MLNNDVVNYIIKFSFGNCNICKKKVHFTKLKHNVEIIKYKNVFEDDYFFSHNKRVKKICNNCTSCLTCVTDKLYIDIHNYHF